MFMMKMDLLTFDVYRPIGIVNGQKLYSIRIFDNLVTKVCHEMDY